MKKESDLFCIMHWKPDSFIQFQSPHLYDRVVWFMCKTEKFRTSSTIGYSCSQCWLNVKNKRPYRPLENIVTLIKTQHHTSTGSTQHNETIKNGKYHDICGKHSNNSAKTPLFNAALWKWLSCNCRWDYSISFTKCSAKECVANHCGLHSDTYLASHGQSWMLFLIHPLTDPNLFRRWHT